MPTERFIHLPEEKKRLIREAAIKEFCRVPLEKASINKIVQNAEISRGSFYTYFQDKEDVLEYIMGDVVNQIQDYARNTLRNCFGDFWRFAAEFLDYILKICEENQIFILLQSVSGNGRIMQMLHHHCRPFQEQDSAFIDHQIALFEEELYQMTDCSKLRINSFEEFQIMYTLFMMSILTVIDDIFRRNMEKKAAKWAFAKRMDYLKDGVSIKA